MALPIRTQALWWGIGLLAVFALFWLLGDVLAPFIAGAAIAYLLNPTTNRIERAGVPRPLAVSLAMTGALLVLVFLGLMIVPLVAHQTAALAAAAPGLAEQFAAWLDGRLPGAFEPGSALQRALSRLGEAASARSGDILRGVAGSIASIVGAVLFVVVAPVVAFYLLLDWNGMLARADEFLPREHRDTIRRLVGDMDRALAGFVRGQLSVCVLLGAFYAVLLMLVGLQYGLAVGVIAGLISFIPYVGTVVGGVLAIGLALFQFWEEPLWIGVVVVIFATGQFLEGNILTPRLVGRSVGLHPVWLLLALTAFGSLFGFAGMLVAVPVAAVIGVLFRFGLEKYLDSPLYGGKPRGHGNGEG